MPAFIMRRTICAAVLTRAVRVVEFDLPVRDARALQLAHRRDARCVSTVEVATLGTTVEF
jgi:hypothetical protein